MSDGGVDESKRATLRRFAALGAATPLVHLSSEGDSDARDAILGYLATTPGAHFSKIRDDLQLGTGETQHHLRQLETDQVIEKYADGEYKRYFPATRFSAYEKLALGYLRRRTPRNIIMILLSSPDVSGRAIASELNIAPSTVSKTISELKSAELLEQEPGYHIEDPETLLTLLVRYAESFDSKAVEFADSADSLVVYDP